MRIILSFLILLFFTTAGIEQPTGTNTDPNCTPGSVVNGVPGGTNTCAGTGGGGATGPPTVTLVSPSSGPLAGGTFVTINGTQFIGLSGASAVVFGATNATSYTVLSNATITAISPAHTAGTIDIRITNTIGTSAIVAADQFTYSTCTNSMDFTQACNSQYIGAF